MKAFVYTEGPIYFGPPWYGFCAASHSVYAPYIMNKTCVFCCRVQGASVFLLSHVLQKYIPGTYIISDNKIVAGGHAREEKEKVGCVYHTWYY